MCVPHLSAVTDSLCFFFKMQQIATVGRPTISATIATIAATRRVTFSAVSVDSVGSLGVGAGVTGTQRESK